MDDAFPSFGEDRNPRKQDSFPNFGAPASNSSTVTKTTKDDDGALEKNSKPKERMVLKIIVLGTSNVGKTSLMRRYVTEKYTDLRRPTTGADFMTRQIEIDGSTALLQIWDTAGQERFHRGTLGHAFYRGADGALLVYDVAQPRSFDQIEMWREELLSKIDTLGDGSEDFPIVLAGNKTDLLNGADPENIDYITKWCQSRGIGQVRTCAKDGTGVADAMRAIAGLALVNKMQRLEKEKQDPEKYGRRRRDVVDISTKFEQDQPKEWCCG